MEDVPDDDGVLQPVDDGTQEVTAEEVEPVDGEEVDVVELGELQQYVRASVELTSVESILPPPELLARYSEVLTNGADRAFKVIESETTYAAETERIAAETDRKAVEGAIAENTRGQGIARELALLAVACAVGFGVWGGVVSSAGLLVLAGVFLAMPVALIIKAFLGD